MNTKTKKILLLVGPLVLGGAVIYALNHKSKKKPGEIPDAPSSEPEVTPVLTYKPPVATSVFPLKVGSRNDKVKELQNALAITADGIFGSQTQSKLQAFAGISQVDDQAELDDVKRKAAGITNQARANDLVSKFKAGGVAIYVNTTFDAQQVSQDSYGALLPTGRYMKLYAGKTYNNQDYKLVGSTKLGKIQIQVTRGDLLGLYLGDPNNLTVKPV